MKKITRILLILVCCWLAAINCSASFIALKTDPSSRFRPGGISVNVRITNQGDESAMKVWVEASIMGQSGKSEICEALGVQKTHNFTVNLGMPPARSGIYTIVTRVHYSDANRAPFMALNSIPIVTATPEPEEEPLSGEMNEYSIQNKTSLTLNFKTTDSNDTEINASLVLPKELHCHSSTQKIKLPAGGKKELKFKITNKSALPGSSYYIFAILDYDNGDQHRSIVVPGKINVVKPSHFKLVNFDKKGTFAVIVMIICAILFGIAQIPRIPGIPKRALPVFDFFVLISVLLFILSFFPMNLIFSDTLTTGGDIPAHSYLSSQIKENLLEHGEIISWADGWWAGFPIFQYYFCLPYVMIALLSFIIPFNIAFKLISILGIAMLPICAWFSGRIMRLPRPSCHLLAIATIPLLFDHGHVMWGVNMYSTLAGMISNSISFPIMLLFVACACRDADDGKMRFRTIALLTLLIASHFFTFIIAVLSVAFIPLFKPRAGFTKAVIVLVKEGLLALLIMSWWLVPLIAKQEYSVDFGTNWNVKFSEVMPGIVGITAMTIGLLTALLMAILERKYRFIPITLCILLSSTFLFFFGFKISPVFVNVRLYPFIAYSLLALSAAGIGIAMDKLKLSELGVIAIMIAIMIFGIGQPNHVNAWAKWNYSGIEGKANYDVIEQLVLPLKDTPGRLANDLHDNNNSLGSTRVFECVPHLIGKPILEGGIVNSALGSMFSYYIQGETSKSCAGYPSIVKPTSFNMKNATRHLELFNVKHFIARWKTTKKALAESGDWKFINRCRDWELYELTSHNCEYVFIPKYSPVAVTTDKWKEAGLDWIYQIRALDQPFAIMAETPEENEDIQRYVSEEEFHQILTCLNNTKTFPSWFKPAYSMNLLSEDAEEISIVEEKTSNGYRFRTNAIGLPHIIKCSWFPNWKVRGAKKIYKVTPCFMLVYPEQSEVELYYGSTLADNAGRTMTVIGLVILAVTVIRTRRKSKKPNEKAQDHGDEKNES